MKSNSVITVKGQWKNNGNVWKSIDITDLPKYFYVEKLKNDNDKWNHWVKHTNRPKHISIYVDREEYNRVIKILSNA